MDWNSLSGLNFYSCFNNFGYENSPSTKYTSILMYGFKGIK